MTNGIWEKAGKVADWTLWLPGGIPLFFRRIPAGLGRIGARGVYADEEPVHRICFPHDFYLGTFAVTQEQYAAVAKNCDNLKERADPSGFKGGRRPVEQMDWRGANWFFDRLTRNTPNSPFPPGFERACLPTEAEWEYACRAGSGSEYYNGDGEESLPKVGWFNANSGAGTHAVDELEEAHPFGLYGMHGNVWEWCHDVYDEGAYRSRANGKEDPGSVERLRDYREGLAAALQSEEFRVLRGGSWVNTAGDCRSAFRGRRRPGDRVGDVGFRVCLVRGPVARRGAPVSRAAEAAPGPEDAGRRTRPESDGPGAAGARPALSQAGFPPLLES